MTATGYLYAIEVLHDVGGSNPAECAQEWFIVRTYLHDKGACQGRDRLVARGTPPDRIRVTEYILHGVIRAPEPK